MPYRPRIGLTMRLELETRRFYLGRDYSEAIEAAGGLPVHIPLIAEAGYIRDVVAGLDGFLLPGSDTDVDPVRYSEQPHPALKKVVPEKDETDALVLEEAERRNVPVLAICYGMQALNVARGGSLIQDLAAAGYETVKHEQGPPLARSSHSIAIEPGSLIASIAKGESARVNSHHHQAISRVGRDLVATAWAHDQVIEAVEDTRDDRFVLGVQWHPELSWNRDELSREIFIRFVSECARRVEVSSGLKAETERGLPVM